MRAWLNRGIFGRFSRSRVVYPGLFLTFLLLLIIGRGCFFRPATDYPGKYFNQGENAAWLGVEWVQDLHTMEEIDALANELKRRQIRYVFVFTSYLKSNGEFSPTFTHAAAFVNSLKMAYPEVVILAWLGLPLKNSDRFNVGYVDLANPLTRSGIAFFIKNIITKGNFDGIHLDPEPIASGDVNVLTLLEQVRVTIGPEATLSLATRRINPIFTDIELPWSEQIIWDKDYYLEIANRVDQIAVMTYDSMMPTQILYQQFVRFQVIRLSRAVEETGVQLLIGIPTSEEKTTTHNPNAENIVSGLQGLIAGLNDAEARPKVVSGIAIYPHWEMDATEWEIYESLWLGND